MSIGQFGPRVIGERQYRREQKIIQKAAHKYGRRVVDPDEYEESGAETVTESHRLPDPDDSGSEAESDRVREQDPTEIADIEPREAADTEDVQGEHPAAGADRYLSVREMGAALDANPALVDVFLDPELDREAGPRKTALTAMERAEHDRAGGARQEVLDRIREALG